MGWTGRNPCGWVNLRSLPQPPGFEIPLSYRYATDPLVDRSLRHSVRDGAAYAVMSGSGETYFSAFAVFLKASTAQIGFLASVPPLLASFAQLLSAWLGHVFGNRRAIILAGAGLQALVWLPMLWLPWLDSVYRVEWFIVLVTLYYAFGNLAAPQWSSLMGDLVSEKKRGRFFARRTAISSISSFIALVLAGLVLNHFDGNEATKWGYALLFLVACVARLVSLYHLVRMHHPSDRVAVIDVPIERPTWHDIKNSRFAGFAGYFALIQFSVALASPFFSVYLLRDLEFSYLEFMLLAAVSVIMQFLTLNLWGRFSDSFGNRVILRVCGSLIPLVPLSWLVSTDFVYLLVVQGLGGMVWAGFSLSASNFLYDLVPPHKRVTYMAAHNVLAGIGVFAGALLGGYLGSVMPDRYLLMGYELIFESPLYNVFLLSFLCRALVSMVLIPRIHEVRRVQPVTMRRLIFRVVRFNPLTGVYYDIVSSRRKSAKTDTHQSGIMP